MNETMEDYVEEFEPLDYEAELLNFCNVLDQNKIKFQNKTQDETILNSEIMDNLEKLSEAIAALDEATNQKENVRLKTSNEEKNLEDILNEVKAISKREQTTKKKLLGISETVEKKKSELHTKRNQNASSSDLYKEKQNVMSSELEKWKKTLGLELIRSTHEGLIFKFTNVQRDDPDKIFTCELSGIYLLFSNEQSFLFKITNMININLWVSHSILLFQLRTEFTELITVRRLLKELVKWWIPSTVQMTFLDLLLL